jgi:ribosomal protein S18 acetylase RimI-like enzyme
MTTTSARLRAFSADDYPAWVAGSNLCKTRIVTEEDGGVVGSVEVHHRPSRFHPDRYGFDVWVLPDRRRRGLGSALHDAGLKVLRERNAIAATSGVKESTSNASRERPSG